jgi:hypothetical protein
MMFALSSAKALANDKARPRPAPVMTIDLPCIENLSRSDVWAVILVESAASLSIVLRTGDWVAHDPVGVSLFSEIIEIGACTSTPEWYAKTVRSDHGGASGQLRRDP